jgi:hypothetical protein
MMLAYILAIFSLQEASLPRWFWVDIKTESAAFLDVETLVERSSTREFWVMYVRDRISPRGEAYDLTHYLIDCAARTISPLSSSTYNERRRIVHTVSPLFASTVSISPESHGERLSQHVCSAPGEGPTALPSYRAPLISGRQIFALHRVGLDYAQASILASFIGRPGFRANHYIEANVPASQRAAVRRALGLTGREP